jgi:transcriptional regulator with XRE-family HTH domain
MSDTTPPPDVFPERLRSARGLRELSQGELAAKAGLPAASISHFESGGRKPSFANLRRLAGVLDVTTDYLLGRVDSPEMGRAADPLYRNFERLNDADRQLADDFMNMLASRRRGEPGGRA